MLISWTTYFKPSFLAHLDSADIFQKAHSFEKRGQHARWVLLVVGFKA